MSHEAIAATLDSSPASAAARVAALLDWAMQQVDSAIDSAGVENVVLVAQSMYDKYIAPLDIPWIPDATEPVVIDMPAKWLIGQIIRGFHEHVHHEPVVPAPVVIPTPTGAAP